MWTFVSLAVAAAPGAVAWWTGRRLLARRDDPALPERIVARTNRLVQVMAASVVVLLFVSPHTPWILALPLLGVFVGGFPTHQVLHEDRRGLIGYLFASARWWLAVFGIWTLLALTPAIISAAGPARWPVAALLAATLVAWDLVYVDVLRRVLGARPLAREDLDPRFAAIVARARAAAPQIVRFGFPGGRVVNAFALPSRRRPTVLFGDQLLELLEPDEVAAIFAHEVAHLEHFDRKRLMQARATMWTIIGLTVVVAPLLGQWTLGLSGYLEAAWAAAVALGLLLMGAARQKHEAESDLRALELCGDPDALVRGLVKLHALAHLPRRWALDFERHASHPSLARRIQAIRAAANTAPARFDRPLVVPTATSGTFVVLDSERAEWLEGVAAGTPLESVALREQATRSRAWRYSELVELRVRPGSGEKVFLAATDRSGSAWSVPLRPEDVAVVQSALDVVDVRLAQRSEAASWPALLVRAVAATAVLAAMVASSALSVFVAGAIAVFRPHGAPLAALAVAALGAALLSAGRDGWTLDTPAPTALVLALLSAVGLAALLLLRRSEAEASEAHRRVAALTVGALAAVALVSLAPLLSRSDPRPLDYGGLMATVPSVFVAASGAGAALLGRGRRWGRWAGITLVIVGGVPLGLEAAWPNAASVRRWPDLEPTLLHRTELARPGIELRTSPSGQRLAVRVLRQVRGETPWAFRILGAAHDGRELAADDLAFLDDERLVVVRREDTTLRLALIGGDGSAEPSWRLALPDIRAARLMLSPATRAWTVVGSEPESESVVVAAAGFVGRDEIRVKRWPLAGSDESSGWTVTGSDTAFRVRMRMREDWYWRWPLLPALLGSLPFDSEVWRRGPEGDHRVASASGAIQCMPPTGEGVVCLGYGTTARVAWVFRDGSPDAGSPAILPASTWKIGLSQNRLLGMTSANTVVVLDEDGQRGVQLTLPRETNRALDAVLAGRRLAVLTGHPGGGVVSVYALP
jgi:Zn-dependent protease with chaperone function